MAQEIRLQYKEITSIEVSKDCYDNYDRSNPDHEILRETTKTYLINNLKENNPDFKDAVLYCQYSPIKHKFILYNVVPYIAETCADNTPTEEQVINICKDYNYLLSIGRSQHDAITTVYGIHKRLDHKVIVKIIDAYYKTLGGYENVNYSNVNKVIDKFKRLS